MTIIFKIATSNSPIHSVFGNVDSMKTEITDLKGDIESNVNVIKRNLNREDVQIKEDINLVQKEVGSINGEVKDLAGDIIKMKDIIVLACLMIPIMRQTEYLYFLNCQIVISPITSIEKDDVNDLKQHMQRAQGNFWYRLFMNSRISILLNDEL